MLECFGNDTKSRFGTQLYVLKLRALSTFKSLQGTEEWDCVCILVYG